MFTGLGRHTEFSKTVFTYFEEQDIMEVDGEITCTIVSEQNILGGQLCAEFWCFPKGEGFFGLKFKIFGGTGMLC